MGIKGLRAIVTQKTIRQEKGLITPDGKRASNLPVSIWKENFPLPDRPFPLPITSNINAPIKYYNDVVHSNIELCGPEFAKEKLSGRKLRQLQSKVRLLDPKFKFLDSENRLLSEVDHLTPLSDQPKYIGDLSEAEFKKLLVKAKKLWLQFDDLVERGIYSSEEWYKLLNVSPHPLSSFDADGTGASFVHPPTYLSKEYVAREKDKDPELAELIPEQEYIKVQGRVLNRVTGGYSVGIAGYVAFCSVMNYEMDRAHRLTSTSTMRHFYEDFWVLDARLDRNGKPEIHVSRRDPRVNARMQGKKVVESFGKVCAA